jgi:hypothetical protein
MNTNGNTKSPWVPSDIHRYGQPTKCPEQPWIELDLRIRGTLHPLWNCYWTSQSKCFSAITRRGPFMWQFRSAGNRLVVEISHWRIQNVTSVIGPHIEHVLIVHPTNSAPHTLLAWALLAHSLSAAKDTAPLLAPVAPSCYSGNYSLTSTVLIVCSAIRR